MNRPHRRAPSTWSVFAVAPKPSPPGGWVQASTARKLSFCPLGTICKCGGAKRWSFWTKTARIGGAVVVGTGGAREPIGCACMCTATLLRYPALRAHSGDDTGSPTGLPTGHPFIWSRPWRFSVLLVKPAQRVGCMQADQFEKFLCAQFFTRW